MRADGVRATLVSFEGRRQINKARAAILKMCFWRAVRQFSEKNTTSAV